MAGPTERETRAQGDLAQRLAATGFVLPGSLVTRRMRCGKANCHCHEEGAELHGPYLQWTRTVGGKTMTQLLSEDLVTRYRGWFENARHLHETLRQLEKLSAAILERDRREPSQARSRRNDNAQNSN